MRREIAKLYSAVIASEATQSMRAANKKVGLLRFARNDDSKTALAAKDYLRRHRFRAQLRTGRERRQRSTPRSPVSHLPTGAKDLTGRV
jgi:hypothetical protein